METASCRIARKKVRLYFRIDSGSIDKTPFTGYNTHMDSIILSFELGTFPDSGIYLNIGDAGHVDPEREGDLVYFLTDTNGGPEVIISKQTAMLLYEDGFYAPNCTTIPWSEQIIYCEDALAKMYDRPTREPGDDYVEDNESRITGWRTFEPDSVADDGHHRGPEPTWDDVSRHDCNEGW